MRCRFADLRNKEVINICDGGRLGFIDDVDIEMPEGKLCAVIVPGGYRFFGLFGRGEEYYIPWESVKRIGDDIILIDRAVQRQNPSPPPKRRRRFM
jgi:YlmC/YmxH family sporulation protein